MRDIGREYPSIQVGQVWWVWSVWSVWSDEAVGQVESGWLRLTCLAK